MTRNHPAPSTLAALVAQLAGQVSALTELVERLELAAPRQTHELSPLPAPSSSKKRARRVAARPLVAAPLSKPSAAAAIRARNNLQRLGFLKP